MTPSAFSALSGIHFGMHASEVSEATLAALPQSFADHTPGDMTYDEPATAPRPEIGLVNAGSALYAITCDDRARGYMTALAKSSRWFPVHQSVSSNPGQPIRWDLNPNTTMSTSDIVADPEGNTAIVVEAAHDPHFLYFYALLMRAEGNNTEFQWALTQMKFWCSWNYLTIPPNGRGYGKNIANPIAMQERAAAWDLAWLLQTFSVMPTDDPYWPSYKSAIEENILFRNGMFNLGTYITDGSDGSTTFAPYYSRPAGWVKNNLGIQSDVNGAYGPNDGTVGYVGGFQEGFHSTVVLFGYKLLLAGKLAGLSTPAQTAYAQLANWVAKFPIGMCGQKIVGPVNGDLGSWDWRRCGTYALVVGPLVQGGPTNGKIIYPDTFGTMYNYQYGVGSGYPAGLPDDNIIREHDQNGAVPGLANSYASNLFTAVSLAVDCGIAGADQAYARLTNATIWSAGLDASSCNYAILPEGRYFADGVYTSAGSSDTPIVSAIDTSPGDVDLVATGLQEYTSTTVTYLATVVDTGSRGITSAQWYYSVNGGARVAYGSPTTGAGAKSVTFTYGGTPTNYAWSLDAINSIGNTGTSSLAVFVVNTPSSSGSTSTFGAWLPIANVSGFATWASLGAGAPTTTPTLASFAFRVGNLAILADGRVAATAGSMAILADGTPVPLIG